MLPHEYVTLLLRMLRNTGRPVLAVFCVFCLAISSRQVLIYVFDVESTEGSADLDRYRGVLEAVEANSPDARYAHYDPPGTVA